MLEEIKKEIKKELKKEIESLKAIKDVDARAERFVERTYALDLTTKKYAILKHESCPDDMSIEDWIDLTVKKEMDIM